MCRPALAKNDARLTKLMERVCQMARELSRRLPPSVELDDLIAAGNLGVATALARSAGDAIGIESYALSHARGAMLDELRRLDTMSRGGRRNARRADAIATALRTRLGRTPEEHEIASAMEMDVGDYRKLACRMGYVSIDADSVDDRGGAHDLALSCQKASIEERIDDERARRAVAEKVAELPPRHATVIALSFHQDQTLEAIAKELGVSIARVGQLRKAALDKIRKAYVSNEISAKKRAA